MDPAWSGDRTQARDSQSYAMRDRDGVTEALPFRGSVHRAVGPENELTRSTFHDSTDLGGHLFGGPCHQQTVAVESAHHGPSEEF